MTCDHSHYNYSNGYLTSENALKAMKANKVCWMGMVIKNCDKCGADIRYARVVKIKSPEQYIKEMGL